MGDAQHISDVDSIQQIQDAVEKKIQEEKAEFNLVEPNPQKIDSKLILSALGNGEDGDADLFIFLNKDKLCYDHNSDQWYLYKNGYWTKDLKNQHLVSFHSVIDTYEKEIHHQTLIQHQAITDDDKDLGKNADKIKNLLIQRKKKLHTFTRKKNVLKLAASGELSLGITGDEWDSQKEILACKNGIIDLKTGELKKSTPQDYIKSVAPVIFESIDTPAPVFETFLSSSLNNRKELVDFVQRILGCAISGRIMEHKIPILWGKNGRNGKGTLMEVIYSTLGHLMCPIPSEMLLKQPISKSATGPSPEIIKLQGKRIVWASETEEGRHLDVSRMKWYTGGDTLTARGIYEKNSVDFEPTHSIFMLTNHRPHIPSNETAIWQRIFLIPFELSFVENPKKAYERQRDPHLKEKLLKEKSGILAWLIRGHLAYQREGLNPPETVLQQTQKYQENEDSISSFIKECCSMDSNQRTLFKEIFESYETWCQENGIVPESKRKVGTKLTDDFEKINTGVISYKGISLQKQEKNI